MLLSAIPLLPGGCYSSSRPTLSYSCSCFLVFRACWLRWPATTTVLWAMPPAAFRLSYRTPELIPRTSRNICDAQAQRATVAHTVSTLKFKVCVLCVVISFAIAVYDAGGLGALGDTLTLVVQTQAPTTLLAARERAVLSDLHLATNGTGWWNSRGWLSTIGDPCTSWRGVSCTGANPNHVLYVHVSSMPVPCSRVQTV